MGWAAQHVEPFAGSRFANDTVTAGAWYAAEAV
jgi:hypothetical protein